jgi:hypothetical protein
MHESAVLRSHSGAFAVDDPPHPVEKPENTSGTLSALSNVRDDENAISTKNTQDTSVQIGTTLLPLLGILWDAY